MLCLEWKKKKRDRGYKKKIQERSNFFIYKKIPKAPVDPDTLQPFSAAEEKLGLVQASMMYRNRRLGIQDPKFQKAGFEGPKLKGKGIGGNKMSLQDYSHSKNIEGAGYQMMGLE